MRALPVPDVIDSSFGEFMAEVLASRRPSLADIEKRARQLRETCDALSYGCDRDSAALVADEIDHLLRDFMACDLPDDCDRDTRAEWLTIASQRVESVALGNPPRPHLECISAVQCLSRFIGMVQGL